MGNIYRQLDCASEVSFSESIRSALVEKFGNDVTIHNTSTFVIFSCPHLSDRVIKIGRMYAYYGSSYSSGVNITNSVTLTILGTPTTAHIVLGDNFLFIVGQSNGYRTNIVVAKTVGGKYIIGGSHSNTSYTNEAITIDLTNNKRFDFVDIDTVVMCDAGAPYKMPLMMGYTDNVGGSLMLDDNGNPDTIKDLYMSTYSAWSDVSHLAVNNAVLSCRKLYTNGTSVKPVLLSSIMAEF